jgi:hypothetical protein
VDHRHGDATQLELEDLGQDATEGVVVVAEHGVHGCEAGQLVEQLPGDDVAGVEDGIGPREERGGRTRQPSPRARG